MSRPHKTTPPKENSDGSKHYTRHSYSGVGGKGYRQSFDKTPSGQKVNWHATDQNTGQTYYIHGTQDGNHKTGDVTDRKGNFVRNNITGETKASRSGNGRGSNNSGK